MTPRTRAVPTPRARARREQLASIAAQLFAQYGFHNVSVNDIAASAGISGPAIYRHFPSKQAILGDVLQSRLEQAVGIVESRLGGPAAGRGPDKGERLGGAYGELAAFVVKMPEFGVLWRRERRHLGHEEAAVTAALMRSVAAPLVGELRRLRPELTEEDAELLSWGALSVLGSVSDHRVRLTHAAFEQLLVGIAMGLVTADVPPVPAADALPGPSGEELPTLDTRREQLLAAAARLFWDRGYHAVTMEEIGAAAGIAGPSIYNHFTNKVELLQTAADRIGERLRRTTAQARVADQPARETLELLVESYVGTVLGCRDLLAAYFSEGHNLPERSVAEARRFQAAYARHWADMVRAVLPDVTEKVARIRVHAAFAVVNDLALTRRFMSRPALASDLRALMLAVLAGSSGTV
ncbi:TetR/AcrR family transcriptional regulator [Streptomyces sp. DT195]|uniref:TetR/AcrR family transcriptional regulator n=1 Tax=Streptomyces sp. DT195 TaxID=3393419 RepID=UPI003CF3AF3D